MARFKLRLIVSTAVALAALAAAFVAAMATTTTSSASLRPKAALGGELGEGGTAAARPSGGLDRLEGFSRADYRATIRAYPAAQVAPAWAEAERTTFTRLAARSPKAPPNPGVLNFWQNYGPQMHATEPGVLNFSGAPYNTASRTAALAISPRCGQSGQIPCRMWAGPVGGGIWRTDDATAADPVWTYVSGNQLGINSIGDIVLDPTDLTEQTLYVGTGEPNNCSSGCEAGVGIWRSTDGGNNWSKLPDVCVNNPPNMCSTPGVDAFLGRGISEIVVDPTNPAHLFVGSAVSARSISHVIIGPEAQVRDEPGANPTGLYESTDGGATFKPVWLPYDGTPANTPVRRGVMDVGLDPLNPGVVYASAIARGVWRRCPNAVVQCGSEASAGQNDFKQVFFPRLTSPLSRERTQFDLTVKNAKTRIYLTTGELGASPKPGEAPSSFWRTDNANQTAAALTTSEPSGAASPPPGSGIPFPATYNGWQILTSNSITSSPSGVASPYWATRNFCTGQCSYDQDVYTPAGRPDTVYVIGSYGYGELPCYTKGVGCGSGISNGRGVLYSTTAGDPDPGFNDRTFTDMTYDAQNVPASWCALVLAAVPCLVAHHSIHPDQHEILINPSNPTQFFEGSDGGINRTNGSFINMSRACFFRGVPAQGIPFLSGNALTQCMRLLSRVPETLGAINTRLGNTIQFENVAVDAQLPCRVIGGTQDNGTWMPVNCDANDFTQVIYGDGGNAGIDPYYDQSAAATGKAWLFNEFTGPFTAANFRGGDPESWVDIFYPMFLSGELVGFYWPQIADPNPPLFNGTGVCNQFLPGCVRTHPIYSGLQHVWRSWAWGAGEQGKLPQDVTPDIAGYEANCPDFYATPITCGDFQPMGGPVGTDAPGDLTGTGGGPYGTSRAGSQISWVARRAADRNVMWATTSTGRVFITRNADALDPANVVWYRIDSLPTPGFGGNCPANPPTPNPTSPPGGSVNCSPDRHPNGIYPDPNNPDVAYVVYSGFNGATPGTPGHVFRVTITNNGSGIPSGATFQNLNVENGGTSSFPTSTSSGDLPINDIVMDDATGNLYAASDFGVLKGTPSGGGFAWSVTPGMPKQEITHLAMVPGQRDACRVCGGTRLLYAATHAQGIWLNRLG